MSFLVVLIPFHSLQLLFIKEHQLQNDFKKLFFLYLEENVTKETILEDTTHHNETLFEAHEDEEAGSKGYVVGKGFNSLIWGKINV